MILINEIMYKINKHIWIENYARELFYNIRLSYPTVINLINEALKEL